MSVRSSAAGDLLERGEELSMLAESLGSIRDGAAGRVVLVGGEAGVGKTALLRRFCEEHAEDALRRALAELQRLGARPAAAIVAGRLRARGARLPRGPRPATRANPAGLTGRELEVLALLAEGLRNADIAARLVVSPRTVDHQVSSILRKLEVRTRAQAGAEAVRLGLAGQDR